jgi:dolichol-phosphate mannosyltransferase
LLWHKENKNLGGGLQTAFCYFDRNGKPGDLCVIMDGDHTQKPFYIHSMLNAMTPEKDCVIASRYKKGSEVHGVPVHRLLFSDTASVFYTLLLHVPHVRDYTCGYRVYRYEIIHRARSQFGRKFIEMKTFSCMLEVLYKLYLLGAEFDEVPFSLRYDDKKGKSKMRIVKTVLDSLKTAFRLKFLKIKNI